MSPDTDPARDIKGISELPLIQLIFNGKIICIRGSSDIPLLSLPWSILHPASAANKYKIPAHYDAAAIETCSSRAPLSQHWQFLQTNIAC